MAMWFWRAAKFLLAGVVLAFIAGLGWLYAAPPELLRVGSGYAAKIVCSNVFLAKRDAGQVLQVDVQAPGHPLLRFMSVAVDEKTGLVRASLPLGIAEGRAQYRQGFGCTSLPGNSTLASLPDLPVAETAAPDEKLPWPQGEAVNLDPKVQAVIEKDDLAGPGFRAVVVVKDGRIVAERYGAGFDRNTPLLGWSMTKSVNAVLLGTLLKEGKLSLDDAGLFPEWKNDQRAAIKIRDLLGMESGLTFNENYGTVADVTRMLYLRPDMASYVASLPAEVPPAQKFNYSTGTSVLLAKLWMRSLKDEAAALAYPRRAFFNPLGMRSATLELDASNTLVGGSYLYAAPRDWLRLAQMLVQDGVWNGQRLLPEGFVAQMASGTQTSDGRYSHMQTWLPKALGLDLPAGSFQLQGHDGQWISVNPAERLIVLRMGLTPSKLRYKPAALIEAVRAALRA